ncbi:hypothetical protein EI94DRAFT_1698614 [Lactarius quietus]|nr:hypothetical protein EI94DRAFT_1698614 [Lactarius quietus]
MSELDPISYAAVLNLVEPPVPEGQPMHQLNEQAVLDDLEGEQEAAPYSEEGHTDVLQLLSTVDEVSKGVSEGTHVEYQHLKIQCEEFLVQKGLVTRGQFFSNKPHKYAPQFIVAWILNECDELNLNGTRQPSEEVHATYGTAQKMRASMTYAFGRLHGLGSMHWVYDPVEDTVAGNPSVSEMVSRYMLSLRRHKVKAGETATSARAISAEVLLKMYVFNHSPENWDLKPYTSGTKDKAGKQWGGPHAQRLLELAYTIAFTCLLRVDEVLKIKSQDFTLLLDDKGEKLQLTLPYRKTNPYGGVSNSQFVEA